MVMGLASGHGDGGRPTIVDEEDGVCVAYFEFAGEGIGQQGGVVVG